MFKENHIGKLLLICTVVLCSCNEDVFSQDNATKEEKAQEQEHKDPHPYGGWFCPDNFGGFPPVDIKDLGSLNVVSDRLPTKEEASDGSAVMFIDTDKFPEAKAFEMDLPKVGRVYSSHNGLNELVVVIQAVVVGNDTVVGYRFPNGGNGSAWIQDIDFLSESELDAISDSPFVYYKTEVEASKQTVWRAIAESDFGKMIADKFDKHEFINKGWTDESRAHLNLENEDVTASGIVMTMWGNLYVHIDYDYNGFHYSEKILVVENDGVSELHYASGPYHEGFGTENQRWELWMKDIKKKCEAE